MNPGVVHKTSNFPGKVLPGIETHGFAACQLLVLCGVSRMEPGGAWGYLSDADFTSKHGAICLTKSGHNMDMVVFNHRQKFQNGKCRTYRTISGN